MKEFIDNLPRITINDLKKLELIKPGGKSFDILRLDIQGKYEIDVQILVDLRDKYGHARLEYTYRRVGLEEYVGITNLPSNLGNGLIWYFICPATYKRCRNLYYNLGRFSHREAFPGFMYKSQINKNADLPGKAKMR